MKMTMTRYDRSCAPDLRRGKEKGEGESGWLLILYRAESLVQFLSIIVLCFDRYNLMSRSFSLFLIAHFSFCVVGRKVLGPK